MSVFCIIKRILNIGKPPPPPPLILDIPDLAWQQKCSVEIEKHIIALKQKQKEGISTSYTSNSYMR